MSNTNPQVMFVCAYHPEAIALIDYFKLKRDMSLSHFAYYRGDRFALIETGPGKINAASATAYIAGKLDLTESAWLNVGIAGHRTKSVGEGILCNKITDNDTAQNYYPDMSHKGSLSTHALTTINIPENTYPKDTLYDMEAAGFFHSASCFSTIEHIHCFKIISDNLLSPVKFFDTKNAASLIQNCLEDIQILCDTLCNAIDNYREIYSSHAEYDIYIEQLHFTSTQRVKLKVLLRRWHAFDQSSLLNIFLPKQYSHSKTLLQDISKHVHKISTVANSRIITQD